MSVYKLNQLDTKTIKILNSNSTISFTHFLSKEDGHLREEEMCKNNEQTHKIQNYVNKIPMWGQRIDSNYFIKKSKIMWN